MRKDIYLVDFFDTIMFRHVHPSQVIKQWANVIQAKFLLQVSAEELVQKRRDCFVKIREKKNEAEYQEVMMLLYDELSCCDALFAKRVGQAEFLSYAREVELATEVGVQYPNKRLLKQINNLKKKGVKICIASDFYFGKRELKYFMSAKGIDSVLFDEIFVSSDCNARKKDGTLYAHILSCLSCEPAEVCMIGDNYINDRKQAQAHGISTEFHPRVIYKVCLRMKKKMQYDYSKHIAKSMVRDCYRFGLPFSEYIAIFFSFTERLKKQLSPECKVVFLAREGFFLKQLFELYEHLVFPNKQQTKTAYFLCSRRAISSTRIEDIRKMVSDIRDISVKNYLVAAGFSDEEILNIAKTKNLSQEQLDSPIDLEFAANIDEEVATKVQENKLALHQYIDDVIGDQRPVHVIDVGWRGRMQAGLEELLGTKTNSFYLGLNGDPENSFQVQKTGLVFSEAENMGSTQYFAVLSTNIQLYELLLAAPHGSAQTYLKKSDHLEVLQRWEENERNLYCETIQTWQEQAIVLFSALAVWSSPKRLLMSNKRNADIVMRSALFANRERLEFLHALDRGFVWNFGKEVKGLSYDRKQVKIRFSIIYAPERYLRYAAKVQRLLPKKNVIQNLYKTAAAIYWLYVKIILWLKNVF